MTLGEKLETIGNFIYRSAKQSFGAFGVDADPALAALVIDSVAAKFRQEAADAARNALFALEDRLEHEKELKEKEEAAADA